MLYVDGVWTTGVEMAVACEEHKQHTQVRVTTDLFTVKVKLAGGVGSSQGESTRPDPTRGSVHDP